jgi:predicted secreted protein
MSKAFQGIGTKLQRGDGAGPEVFTTIAEMVKVQQSGSKADIVDVTNLDSPNAYKEKLVTILDAGQIAFDGNMVADDATQQAVQADFDGRVLHNWKVILPVDPATTITRGHWEFEAYVTSIDFDTPHDKQATISGKLEITGARTFFPGA